MSTMDAVKTAVAVGDMIAAEEGLVEAYNRISKMLKDIQVREQKGRASARTSGMLWPDGKNA